MIPSHKNYSFSLKSKDIRLIFAINCGSVSLPSKVPIFIGKYLDEQLDITLKTYLETQFVLSRSTLSFPQVCQWYFADFKPSEIQRDQFMLALRVAGLSERGMYI